MAKRAYHPAAFDSALALVRRMTSAETAFVVEELIRARSGKRLADLTALARRNEDVGAVRSRVSAASSDFAHAFGIPLVRAFRPPSSDDEECPCVAASGDNQSSIFLAPAFLDVLDRAMVRVTSAGAPEPDVLTATWVAIAGACPASGRGHHLALRCLHNSPREPTDTARLIAARIVDVHLIADVGCLELAVLRAELHGKASPAVVVADLQLLSEPSARDVDDFDRPTYATFPNDRLSDEDERRMRMLRSLRNTYVWRAQHDLVIDGELAAFFGGAIGPLVATDEWRHSVISDFAPGMGAVGIKALCARVADPRDADALAATAFVAGSIFDIDLNEAAILVASSLSPPGLQMPSTPAEFDARLVVCDEEGQLLLARASELARQGARILFWGPPGGGKSTFAQALAAAMGRGVQLVTGAAVLARGWGVTERIIAKLWSRAADDGACLIIDELDSLCGQREPGASAGNAYLVRSLTNEILRAFDVYRTVPVIATANHLESIDDAVRRRFTFVVNVRGELTPEAERLAWSAVFDVDPPQDWAPIGANIADFANAKRRCQMLGLMDTRSLAAAVERSREARLGPSSGMPRIIGRLQ